MAVVVIIVLILVLASIPGYIAARKGYSPVAFYFFALLAFFPAFIVALVLSPKVYRTGDIVHLTTRVGLDDGFRLERGYKSKVLDTDVIDGKAVVQMRGPDDRTHWIAASDLAPG